MAFGDQKATLLRLEFWCFFWTIKLIWSTSSTCIWFLFNIPKRNRDFDQLYNNLCILIDLYMYIQIYIYIYKFEWMNLYVFKIIIRMDKCIKPQNINSHIWVVSSFEERRPVLDLKNWAGDAGIAVFDPRTFAQVEHDPDWADWCFPLEPCPWNTSGLIVISAPWGPWAIRIQTIEPEVLVDDIQWLQDLVLLNLWQFADVVTCRVEAILDTWMRKN